MGKRIEEKIGNSQIQEKGIVFNGAAYNLEKPYEKPLFEKQTTLEFPEKIWEKLNGGKYQQACSRCHHCR